jgi:hypothetical protein
MDMDYDFGLTSSLASGLILFIIGIAFFRDRILYIKKGNIAYATFLKQEEKTDDDDNIYYVPYFKFTTRSNKEIIYKHRATNSKNRWKQGDRIKMIYREGLADIHDTLPLIFYDAFGLSAAFLTAGFVLLITAGGIYWEASATTLACLLTLSFVLFFLTLRLWSNWFLNQRH